MNPRNPISIKETGVLFDHPLYVTLYAENREGLIEEIQKYGLTAKDFESVSLRTLTIYKMDSLLFDTLSDLFIMKEVYRYRDEPLSDVAVRVSDVGSIIRYLQDETFLLLEEKYLLEKLQTFLGVPTE